MVHQVLALFGGRGASATVVALEVAEGVGAELGADPVATVALYLALILVAAKLGGDLAVRAGQPAVLGELGVGVLLGNVPHVGVTSLAAMKNDAFLGTFAQLGVIVLLFEVGLESTFRQMLKVGLSSLLVATIGVATPFALGWGVGAVLLPERSSYVHAFLGTALTATSIGITARLLRDLGKTDTDEARIVLGAAVIDDVMGLVALAVMGGVVTAADRGTSISVATIGLTLVKAVVFLVGALLVGLPASPRLFAFAARLRSSGVMLSLALGFCFLLAWLASVIGLSPIVGAFAAGLILEPLHYRDFVARGERPLEELLRPIAAFLVPTFFVLMGMRTDLRSLAQPGAVSLALALIVAAILGKQACYVGVVGRGVDRLSVGIAMIPRGEVGLIFANLGMSMTIKGERIVDDRAYAAVVLTVIVTTMVTPPALKWSLARRAAQRRRPTVTLPM